MTDDDDRHDEAELREAEALAEALERAPEQRATPGNEADALDAADLIAASRLPELSRDRAESVWTQVNARVETQRRRRRRQRALGLAALAGTFAAAAATLLIFVVPADRAREPAMDRVASESLEARNRAVLAQRAWLADPSPAQRTELRARLAEYRAAQFAELDRRVLR